MSMENLGEKYEILANNYELLQERMDEMAQKYQELDWELLEGYDDNAGLSLDRLKQLEEILSDMVETNPLMKRAAQLRHSYIFGEGIWFTGLKPSGYDLMKDEDNRRAMFSVQAQEELNKAKFTAGNVFVIYNRKTKKFTRVPLQEVDALEVDPESNERIWHIKRKWKHNGQDREMWYPTSTYTGPKRHWIGKVNGQQTKRVPVSQDAIIYHETANKQVGWTLGVPDSLAAMSWAIAYKNYLENNATLVKAYSQFAWKVTQQTRRGVDNAAVRIARGGVGGAAVQGTGSDIQALPASGSQVDFNNGQPLAAMVAASLGVPVIALISSPGAAGGSYGAAETLDRPTVIGMQVIQKTWGNFYESIFRGIRNPDAIVHFPKIDSDPAYREVGSAAQAYHAGLLHQSEARQVALNRLNIEEKKKGLPKPDEFIQPKQGAGAGGGSSDPIARQGNSGAVGSPTQDETNNDGRVDKIGGER